jgi:hypothetical protein
VIFAAGGKFGLSFRAGGDDKRDEPQTGSPPNRQAKEGPHRPREGTPVRSVEIYKGATMIRQRCRLLLSSAVFGASLAGAGCQTNIAGMTLPSAYYLQHRPQYFPAEPGYPLPRELATMQAQNAAAAADTNAGVNGRLPAPVIPPR